MARPLSTSRAGESPVSEEFFCEGRVPVAMADAPDSSFVRGPMREDAVEGECPYCGHDGLVMRSLPLEVPYFGDALQTTVLCTACSFRYADLVLAKEGDAARYELRVAGDADLSARVVRSSSGTVRIPELGLTVEPGLRGEAFVSNAEGVLHRVRDVAELALRAAETPAERRRAERVLADLAAMIAGTRPFTLVLEDPTGNSAILHDRARKKALGEKEARRLKRAALEFHVSR